MNDFLKNLRNGQHKPPFKNSRYDLPQYQYEKQHYSGQDKRSGYERRKIKVFFAEAIVSNAP